MLYYNKNYFISQRSHEVNDSIGHFYIQLTDTILGSSIIKGKNPLEGVFCKPLNIGEIKEESKRFTGSESYMKSHKDDIILTTKVISLTSEQYARALMFVSSKEGGIYAAGVDDCIRFTQEVYSVAGLPRNFTDVYTAKELLSFGSAASKAALFRYGSGDSHLSVQGSSLEEVASKYNVPVDRVIEGQSDMHLERTVTQKQFVILSDKVWRGISGLKTLATLEGDEGVSANAEDVSVEQAHKMIADSLQVVNAAFAVAEGKIPASEFQRELSSEVDRTNPDFVRQAKEAEDSLAWIHELTRSTNALLYGGDVNTKGPVDPKPSVTQAKASTVIAHKVKADELDDILEAACSDVFDVEEITRVDFRSQPTSDVFQQIMRQHVESCRETMRLNPFLSTAAGLDNSTFDQSYQDVMDILGVPIFPQDEK